MGLFEKKTEQEKQIDSQKKKESKVKAGVTEGKKELQIVSAGQSAMFKIQFNTGGELPKSLSGLFTSVGEAQRYIDVYLELK